MDLLKLKNKTPHIHLQRLAIIGINVQNWSNLKVQIEQWVKKSQKGSEKGLQVITHQLL